MQEAGRISIHDSTRLWSVSGGKDAVIAILEMGEFFGVRVFV
jgi:hypothetical protein